MWIVAHAVTGQKYAQFVDEWEAHECALELQSDGINAVVHYAN